MQSHAGVPAGVQLVGRDLDIYRHLSVANLVKSRAAWKQYALDAAEVADPHLSGMCCSLYVKFTFSLNHFRELNFLQYLHM